MAWNQYGTMLVFLLPAFGLGWLCGWLWANRPPATPSARPLPEDIAEELFDRLPTPEEYPVVERQHETRPEK